MGAVVAAAGVLGVSGAPAAAQGPRAKVDAVFTTQTPGTSSGRLEHGDFVDPANPGGKPHGVRSVVLQLAEGARWDTDAIPQCSASDVALMASGPSGCPPETRIGQGPVVVDTGFEGSNRNLEFDFTAFNADDGMILVGRERQSGGHIVVRGTISGGRLEIQFPPAPGTPPEGGALKQERIVFFERSEVRDGRRRAYLTTPPTCPASGEWVNRLTYTYGDGVSETVESRSPCVASRDGGSQGAPSRLSRLRVSGVPLRRCTSRAFRARIRVTGGAGVRARVYVDGRKIAEEADRSFRQRVGVDGLRSGVHRLTVKATDANGGRATRRVRFRRC